MRSPGFCPKSVFALLRANNAFTTFIIKVARGGECWLLLRQPENLTSLAVANFHNQPSSRMKILGAFTEQATVKVESVVSAV